MTLGGSRKLELKVHERGTTSRQTTSFAEHLQLNLFAFSEMTFRIRILCTGSFVCG